MTTRQQARAALRAASMEKRRIINKYTMISGHVKMDFHGVFPESISQFYLPTRWQDETFPSQVEYEIFSLNHKD